MKKTLLALALVTSFGAFGQVNSNGDVSGEQGSPAEVNIIDAAESFYDFVIKPLWTRVHTLEIDNKAFLLKSEGKTQGDYVAVFSASGALLYDHEIDNLEAFNPDSIAGRNAGLQVIPYTVSVTSDNRIFVSSSLVGFKNMNSETADNDLRLAYPGGGFSVIDNLEFFKFEYDKNFNYTNIETLKIKSVQLDAKLDFTPESENIDVNVKAGVMPIAYQETKVKLYSNDIKIIEGAEQALRYGMEFKANMKKGWRLNAEAMLGNTWAYNKSKEVVGLNEDGSEVKARPYRTNFYFVPKVELSKKISKEKHSPVRVGVRFSGNFVIHDQIVTGDQRVNLKGTNNQPVVSGGIFLNF